ncbi:MAG TPA: ammonium transporter [Alphaproteobacteria bacterium]|nr:ammonium transporter [Alphaproteobacteria bacterium]
MKRASRTIPPIGAGLAVLALAQPVLAQDAAPGVSAETAYILNTFSFLVHGVLVMFMAAGFAMLEAGLVRSKNVATICLKNISLYSVAGIFFYLVGYNLLYGGESPYFGGLAVWGADDSTALAGDFETSTYASASDWFFQMVFVATAASIVSGTLAERSRLWSFLAFTVALTAVIYPVVGSWHWGGGWLAALGFKDFAGSTLVHSVGGWAALTGAILLGARKGKFRADGGVNPMPGSSLPLATLGTFILWLGWFGFNGGSQLALGSAADAIAIATIYINTNMAAAAGLVAAMITSQLVFRKVDLTFALNGALAGLVSITASPDSTNMTGALIVGAIGGVLCTFAVAALDRLRIDDVVGAIPVHLVGGIWGTIAVAFSYRAEGTTLAGQLMIQLAGVVAVGIFVAAASAAVWLALKHTVGIRVSEENESLGLDKAELGMEAYPEFGQGAMRV